MSLRRLLDTDFLSIKKKDALQMIKKDRQKYSKVYEIIETFAKNKKLILSNKYILLDKPDAAQNIIESRYKIYSVDPFKDANNLTNEIHKNSSDDHKVFTRLKTVKEKEEFTIEYDMRIIAVVYKIQKHKTVDHKILINPVNKSGLLYFPAEIELIDIYHNLYTFTDYEESEEYEKYLFEQVEKRQNEGNIKGGDDTPENTQADTQENDVAKMSCRERRKDLLENLKVQIVLKFIKKNGPMLLIGSWAKDWILHRENICASPEKIQLIAQIEPKELLDKLYAFIQKATNMEITFREQDLHIPKDFRISRYTFYASFSDGKGNVHEKPFLDLFNCANFEVIPYVNIHGICIAHKWVLMRFLFVDLWIIRLIKSLNLISGNVLQIKLKTIWALIEFFKQYDKTASLNVQFIGVYRDYNIDKKIQGLDQKMFFPYYPEVHFNKIKKYREF